MRQVVVSESWGPFSCERLVDGEPCGRACWSIVLTDTENASLQSPEGNDAILEIIDRRLGTALCDQHGGWA